MTNSQVMANNASITAALAKVTELTGVVSSKYQTNERKLNQAASSNKSASRHVREAGHLAEDKVC